MREIMCGIVGIWNKNKESVSPQLLTIMRDSMLSRGPDDSGIWINENIGFAHRRLSILDLSQLGHQPMIDEETGTVIIHNGEVYNFSEIKTELQSYGFSFKNKTDTEVILKSYIKWGTSCLKKFNGMFSFAIWDPIKGAMFIARDRLGIKPLFYYSHDNVFIFASRLSPLMKNQKCPKDIDEEALGYYLDVGFIPAPLTILKGVRKLEPGHFLWVEKNKISNNCYWSLDSIEIDNSLKSSNENELAERLESILTDSVRKRLISDVPLGAFLSGGVDSSLIVALMSKCSSTTPKTFTIGFDEKEYNESLYARQIASHLKTDHYDKIMTSNDLLSLLNDNTKHYDEPLADCSNLPTMMLSRFAKENVKVCLSGDGGDEQFAGYHSYFVPYYLRHLFKLNFKARTIMGAALSKTGVHKLALLGDCLAKKNLLDCFTFTHRLIQKDIRQSIFRGGDIEDLFSKRISQYNNLDEISKFARLDLAYYLADDILQKVDVASMSCSLEVRVPLLDYRIVEFTQKLPLKFKLRGLKSKYLLKRIASKHIPQKLINRPKKGFVAPIDKWFRSSLKNVVQDELSPNQLKKFGYFNHETINNLVNQHLTNKKDNSKIIWGLLSLLRWNNNFRKL